MKLYLRVLLVFLVLSAIAYLENVLACVPLDIGFLSIILMVLLFMVLDKRSGRRRY